MKNEDKHRIFKAIQNIVNSNPVIVVGCGLSMNYGIPGMMDLAEKIKQEFGIKPPFSYGSKKCVKDLIDKLNANVGLEDAMHEVICTEEVEERVRNIVWNDIEPKDKSTIDDFVRRNYRLPMTDLLSHIIYGKTDVSINIVTTNYDCLIEYAASQTDAYVNCGCSQPVVGKFVGFEKKNQFVNLKGYVGCVNIYKIHGSLDWFVDNDDNTRMIYFPYRTGIPENMRPCIITPGANKYERTLEEPHRTLISCVDGLFEKASGYLCIGYGFNDKHLQPKLLKKASESKRKILIVTKDLTEKIKSEVISKVPNYIIVCSDGAKGTRFISSDGSGKLIDEMNEYWKLENFMSIIK